MSFRIEFRSLVEEPDYQKACISYLEKCLNPLPYEQRLARFAVVLLDWCIKNNHTLGQKPDGVFLVTSNRA